MEGCRKASTEVLQSLRESYISFFSIVRPYSYKVLFWGISFFFFFFTEKELSALTIGVSSWDSA